MFTLINKHSSWADQALESELPLRLFCVSSLPRGLGHQGLSQSQMVNRDFPAQNRLSRLSGVEQTGAFLAQAFGSGASQQDKAIFHSVPSTCQL